MWWSASTCLTAAWSRTRSMPARPRVHRTPGPAPSTLCSPRHLPRLPGAACRAEHGEAVGARAVHRGVVATGRASAPRTSGASSVWTKAPPGRSIFVNPRSARGQRADGASITIARPGAALHGGVRAGDGREHAAGAGPCNGRGRWRCGVGPGRGVLRRAVRARRRWAHAVGRRWCSWFVAARPAGGGPGLLLGLSGLGSRSWVCLSV